MECSVSGYFDPVGAETFTVLSTFRMEKNAKIANLNRKWIRLRSKKLTNDLVFHDSGKSQMSKWKQFGNNFK